MIDCQLLLSCKCRCHYLFFPRLRQVSMIIQIRCKNSCRKIGVFFRPYFAKTSCFHHDLRWHKKPTMSFAWQDLLNAVYFCNLVNVFWNNNKRNMERKKLANMNREKAYTKYIYMWHTIHRCNIYVYSHTTSVLAQMITLTFEFIP